MICLSNDMVLPFTKIWLSVKYNFKISSFNTIHIQCFSPSASANESKVWLCVACTIKFRLFYLVFFFSLLHQHRRRRRRFFRFASFVETWFRQPPLQNIFHMDSAERRKESTFLMFCWVAVLDDASIDFLSWLEKRIFRRFFLYPTKHGRGLMCDITWARM